MSIPNLLSRSLEKYGTCRTYRDTGELDRRAEQEKLVRNYCQYTTDFERGSKLLFWGESKGSAGPPPIPLEAVPILAGAYIGKWSVSYDWNTAHFLGNTTHDSVNAPITLSDALKLANTASYGTAELLPALLAGQQISRFWEDLSRYNFTIGEKADATVIICGLSDEDSFEILLDPDTSLFIYIRRIQKVEDKAPIQALENALNLFETPNSEAAKRTRQTIEILSSAELPSYPVISTYRFNSAIMT